MVTVAVAVAAALISIPMRQSRERAMVEAARSEVEALVDATDRFRAEHYRLPGSVADLGRVGYSRSPAIEICRFEYVPDPRRFEEHIAIAVRHRASDRVIRAEHPKSDRRQETSAADACGSAAEGGST